MLTNQNSRFDGVMAMHLQAEVPWRPGQFVVSEITEDDWLFDDEEVCAVVAVFVVDRFFRRMITTG